MLFTDFKNSKQFMKYSRSKLEATIGSLYEAQTKTTKKGYFIKNLSFPTFLEINTSNFQEIFLAILRKFSWKKFLIIKKNVFI